ncbi:MAG: hypothetical protein NVS3B20_02770 [Polyangiales bacterium]
MRRAGALRREEWFEFFYVADHSGQSIPPCQHILTPDATRPNCPLQLDQASKIERLPLASLNAPNVSPGGN